MDAKLNISSSGHDAEFNGRFQIDSETYDVATEDLGAGKYKIVTRIYLKGEIISTVNSDYAHIAKLPGFKETLRQMMLKQQESAKETFIREHTTPVKTKAEFAEEIRRHLTGGDKKAALGTAREALESFADDPFFLSHFGYLTAVVENKSRKGAGICEDAIKVLRKSQSTDMAFFFPLLYFNLGRAYVKGNRKRAAMNAFQEGLKYDKNNKGILLEIKELGVRKSPVIPFLDRSNPANIYLGKLRFKLQGKK